MDDQSPPQPDDLPEDVLYLVKPELQPGERLLWASRAGAGSPPPEYRPSWVALTWFFGFTTLGIACCVGVPFAISGRREGPDALLAIVSLISSVIAFFFILAFLSNFFSKRKERQQLVGQVYALTDRRAVVWVPREKSAVSVHTFQRGTIKGLDLYRVEYPDGSGDVLFRSFHLRPAGFLGVAEVRRVEDMVRRFLVVPNTESRGFADFTKT